VQLFLGLGFVLPLCAMPASFAFSDHGVVTAAVVGPYVGTLAIQIAQELLLLRQSELSGYLDHHLLFCFSSVNSLPHSYTAL
jgi:hypothetical protein